MRSITLLATALLLPVAAPAQDLLADVNQDVLNGLIFQARNEARATVTRTLPAELSRLEIPDQLDLIGTAVRADGNHVTAFRTSQPAGQAFDLLLGALTADGWEVEMQQGMPMQQTVNAPTQIQASMICRAKWSATLATPSRRAKLTRTVDRPSGEEDPPLPWIRAGWPVPGSTGSCSSGRCGVISLVIPKERRRASQGAVLPRWICTAT